MEVQDFNPNSGSQDPEYGLQHALIEVDRFARDVRKTSQLYLECLLGNVFDLYIFPLLNYIELFRPYQRWQIRTQT